MLCLPGTCMAPAIFDRVAVDSPFDLMPFAWMDQPGPWDVPNLARRVRAEVESQDGPVFLAGHSTGGAIALAAATGAPELFSGLILSGTGANMKGHRDVDSIIEGVEQNWGQDLADRIVERSFDTPPTGEWGATISEYARSVRREVVLEVLKSQRDLDLAPVLTRITAPVVVAHGKFDRARPPRDGERLASALPAAELVHLNTGHTPMAEDPDGYLTALRLLHKRAQSR